MHRTISFTDADTRKRSRVTESRCRIRAQTKRRPQPLMRPAPCTERRAATYSSSSSASPPSFFLAAAAARFRFTRPGRVEPDDKRGDVDDPAADADVALADEDAGVVDRLGEARLEDLGLQAALHKVLDLCHRFRSRA